MKICLKILLFCFIWTLSGCASKNIEVQKTDISSTTQLVHFLSSKTPLLTCNSFSCYYELGEKGTHLKMLHESEQWENLAREILQINATQDLTYFYLGRASEGLGLADVAAQYYAIAKSHQVTCSPMLDTCGGFSFPEDINSRLQIIVDEGNEANRSLSHKLKRKQSQDSVIVKNNSPTSKTSGNPIDLQISHSMPTSDGSFKVTIQANADIASMRIGAEELGSSPDGFYAVNRVARAGQETKLQITAVDIYGNSETKIITVVRPIVESKVAYTALNPTKIKRQAERDAVAIIIGISKYQNLPQAVYADDDARAFYDYAIRALGVRPDNIKLLVNQDAGEVEIYKAFKTWLPSRVRRTTDVFVFYSGHGYTTADGKSLYWFPLQADRDLISKTAILVEEINTDLLLTKPKSVTLFVDACYSGQARSGETLIASARPISIKPEGQIFPENFTVMSASRYDQISSSSPDLQHGLFSYYLMRAMEGDADTNRDGRITLGEIQTYLAENVTRQAAGMSRRQEPQLIGDPSRVLVGR
jgi:hypothetical protein